MNLILLLGGLFGLSSVMMAAFVDHALALHLNEKMLSSVLTAVRYHQFYAIFISMIGICLLMQINLRSKYWLIGSACLFIIGVIFFSFSIYLSAIFNIRWLIHFTPIGGVLLMIGWAFLIRVSLLKIKQES